MVAPSSASNRLSGASGWIEVTDSFREEGVADSSDDELDTTTLRALFRVPVVFFFLTFFSGTTYGAGANNFSRRAGAWSSGRGAGQLMGPAIFSHFCQRQREFFRSRME